MPKDEKQINPDQEELLKRLGDIERSVAVEIYKVLFTNSFDYIKTLSQTQQTLTSLLITAYVALLAGFRRDIGFNETTILIQAFLPITFWFAALGVAFIRNISYKGQSPQVGEISLAVEEYSKVIGERRKQLIWPTALTGAGIVAFMFSFQTVFLSAVKTTVRSNASTAPAISQMTSPIIPLAGSSSAQRYVLKSSNKFYRHKP